MNELNKALRFSKQNSDVMLRFPKITDDWHNIHFLVFSDAALGVRQDLASQGGYLILAVNNKVMSGEVGKYSMIGWRSYKLPRVFALLLRQSRKHVRPRLMSFQSSS
jgi:hypothetical protein